MPNTDDTDQERYEMLKRSVIDIGYFRRGSVVRRLMPCGKPGCCCQATPPRLHGPYFQWTRKLHGKTVTVRLSPAEAQTLRDWIANGRRLDRVLAQMERVSLRLTERLLRQTRMKLRPAP